MKRQVAVTTAHWLPTNPDIRKEVANLHMPKIQKSTVHGIEIIYLATASGAKLKQNCCRCLRWSRMA